MFTISYLIHRISIPRTHFSRKTPSLLLLPHDSFQCLWMRNTDSSDWATRKALPEAPSKLTTAARPSCFYKELSVRGTGKKWYSCWQLRHYAYILWSLRAHLCVSYSYYHPASQSCDVLKILLDYYYSNRCLNQTNGYLGAVQSQNQNCTLHHRYCPNKSLKNLDY